MRCDVRAPRTGDIADEVQKITFVAETDEDRASLAVLYQAFFTGNWRRLDQRFARRLAENRARKKRDAVG